MQLEQDVPLAPLTTLQVGGPARLYTRIRTTEDLLAALDYARSHRLRTFVLGGGSNLLVADSGFDGLILHLHLTAPTTFTPAGDHVLAQAAAGTPWDQFVQEACTHNLGGIECLAGIPGLTGGTPVQNVGAYGQEVAQTIESVTALDLTTSTFTTLPNSLCQFAYRASLFNTIARGRYIVTSVCFRLTPNATPNLTYADLTRHFADRNPSLLETAAAVREIRRAKGMFLVAGDPDCRSAGSFFKNPIVPTQILDHIASALDLPTPAIPNWPTNAASTKLPAAWLLEKAGFHKGFTLGAAGISSRHTLALINRTGSATCTDILALRNVITAEVARRFHIHLEQEPVYLS